MKPMVSVSFRWDPEFVERVRFAAGPRGMSALVKAAVERELLGVRAAEPVWSPTDAQQVSRPADDFDTWGA